MAAKNKEIWRKERKRRERSSFSLFVELFIRQATKFEFKISRRRTTLIHLGLGLSS